MRIVVAILLLGMVSMPAAALAQQSTSGTPQNPGGGGGPLGGYTNGHFGASNNPGSGSGDFGDTPVPLRVHGAKDMPKGEYGVDLARRMSDAQRLVDAVDHGRVLDDGDARHIRDLMREDFIAWNKRYDLMPAAYRAERDRWIVDTKAMAPNAWAKQRLDWLEAQRDWILAHGG